MAYAWAPSARAALGMALLALSLAVPGSVAGGAEGPRAATIDGGEASIDAALAGLGDGDGVILVAPGVRYYPAVARHPGKLSVEHVTPGADPFDGSQVDGWKRAVTVPVESPALENGAILGRIGNANVRVVELARMSVPARRCVVILDPEVFPLLYRNEVRGGLVDLSMRLYRSLSDNGAAGFPLYVVDPLSVPLFPLQWGYVDRLWAELWSRPGEFREAIPPRWEGRRMSESLAEFGQFEAAAALLDEARKAFPKDGSIDFQIARLSFLDRQTPQGIRFLVRAYMSDRRYLRGFRETASPLASKERFGEAEAIYRAGLALEKDDPQLNAGLMRLLLSRAESLAGSDPEEAMADLREAIALPGPEELKRRAEGFLAKIGEARRK